MQEEEEEEEEALLQLQCVAVSVAMGAARAAMEVLLQEAMVSAWLGGSGAQPE